MPAAPLSTADTQNNRALPRARLGVIFGPRLALRPLTLADAPMLTLQTRDRRVAEATRTIPHPLPAGTSDAFIAAALDPLREEDVWAIDGSPSGAPALLGVLSLKPLEREQSQIGLWVAPGHWGSGIASEAMRMALEANPQGARTLFAEIFQDNCTAAHMLQNMGFDYIGDAEAISVARGPNPVPTSTWLKRMV